MSFLLSFMETTEAMGDSYLSDLMRKAQFHIPN